MHLVEVDVVGVQAAQAVLDGAFDPARRPPALVWVLPHREPELGRQDHAITTALERLAYDLFGLTVRVDVRGVDEVDPCV